MTYRPRIMTAAEAAGRIADGAGVGIPGNNFRLAPETMLAAIEKRFLERGAPANLTLVYPMMIEASRGTAGVPGTGFNRLARPGLLRRIIGGSFSRVPAHELNVAILSDAVEAYNLPMGTIMALFRAAARREGGLLTATGLETYIDPRRGGGTLNARTTAHLAEVIEFRGKEYLYYPTPVIDTAIIRASLADERGNISFERDAFTLGALHVALAARNSGGDVIIEVDEIVAGGSLDPRKVVIPGHMVTGIVVSELSAMPGGAAGVAATHAPEWSFSGERRAPVRPAAPGVNIRSVIARRALRAVPDGAIVNLGAGLPMYDISQVAQWEGASTSLYRFTLEHGSFGGWPEAGGVAANPDAILDIPNVFDFYTGGGIDVSILSFAEVDADGSVNVSRFGNMMPGCGGFVDITQNARNLVFCGAFEAGGEVSIEDGRVTVTRTGKFSKFVPQLQQLTFNALARGNRAETITYVTERAVFRCAAAGLVVTEVAPGIDLQRDVLGRLPFPVAVAGDIREMDAALFRAPAP
ncbi:MAG: CoA-transferase [Betaproteobacteria bacterium]